MLPGTCRPCGSDPDLYAGCDDGVKDVRPEPERLKAPYGHTPASISCSNLSNLFTARPVRRARRHARL